MEKGIHSVTAADTRGVWKRVAPTLDPWPGADALGKALRDGVQVEGVVLSGAAGKANPERMAARNTALEARSNTPTRNTALEARNDAMTRNTVLDGPTEQETVTENLPGAEPDPCCMGTEAIPDLAVLAGFVEDEQSERRQLQALSRQAPVWARQTLLTLAARAAGRAKRLLAAHYLIVGEAYLPAICTERIYVGKWLPALRERYHSLACTGMNYERAADGTPDPCLGDLLRELSADAFQSAGAVSRILERALAG